MAGDMVWDRAYIESLVENQIPESQGVDYKRQAPKLDKECDGKDRRELLKDVTGMANAGGGVILFGVTNQVTLAPLQDEKPETYDKLTLRLGEWLDAGIEPKLHNLRFDKVDVEGGYVLVLKIPNTMAGPYWAKVPDPGGAKDTGSRIFKIRRGTEVSNMTYHEVREAFDRNSSALIRARDWSQERVMAMGRFARSGEVLGAVHIIPMASYQQPLDPLDIDAMRANSHTLARFFGEEVNARPNFDGYRLSSPTALFPHAQVFRNGAIEMAEILSQPRPDGPSSATWPPFILFETRLVDFIRFALHYGLTYSAQVGPSSSTMVCVSLTNANAATLRTSARLGHADRDTMAVPPFILESITTDEIKRVAKAALDMLFQGYGLTECALPVAELA